MSFSKVVRIIKDNPKKSVAGLLVAGWLDSIWVRKWRARCERREILDAAKLIGEAPHPPGAKPRHLTVIINQHSRGDAVGIYKREVAPVFHMAGIDTKPHQTKHAKHARDICRDLDLEKTSGVIVVGGDGTLQEVLTGLLCREDRDVVTSKLAVGVIPLGTSHAVARLLHVHPSETETSLAGRAALSIAKAQVRPFDVMALTSSENNTIFSMAYCGTGIFGGIATRASRTWPRSWRYHVSGLMTLLMAWPYDNNIEVLRRIDMEGSWQQSPGCWDRRKLSRGDVLVTNLPSLGLGRDLTNDISLDDGYLKVFFMPEEASAWDLIDIAKSVAKGEPLDTHPDIESHKVRELEIRMPKRAPEEEPELNVDGENFTSMSVRIRAYPKAIRFFVPQELSANAATA